MEPIISKIDKIISLNLAQDVSYLKVGPVSLDYRANFDSNFEDHTAYSTGMDRFLTEAATIKKLSDIVYTGLNKHCSLLYTWRSISRTLPQITDEVSNKNEIYKACYDILTPRISLLFDLYNFVQSALELFVSEFSKLCTTDSQNNGISQGILYQMGSFLDMLSTLDDLRSAKTSVKNDFASYKRFEIITKATQGNTERAKLVANVTFFLAQPNEIMNSLTKSLRNTPTYLTILAGITANAVSAIENRLYVSPGKRHHYLRIVLSTMSLMSSDKNAASVLDKKKVPLSRIDKILREAPAIPLMGDMHSNVTIMLKRMNFTYEWSLLDPAYITKLTSIFNICLYLDQFRQEYINIVTEYSLYKCNMKLPENSSNFNFNHSLAAEIYDFSFRACRLLAKWNYTLQEVFFYKMNHPADKLTVGAEADKADNYSLATKYNYNNEEKSAIARIIFFIKSLYVHLKDAEIPINCAINTHIYNTIQEFAHTTVLELQKKAIKSKNIFFKTVIDSISLIITDDADKQESIGKNKKIHTTFIYHQKPVPPRSSQFYMIVTMLNALVEMKETRKFIDSQLEMSIMNFDRQSTYYKTMCDFGDALASCTRMWSYWYKEFYIEISSGARVQYPIEVSFPWIIINYLIEANEPDSYEFILYVMDMYNDSAHVALTTLGCQHLYDEIDAEVQLVFQQMSYLLSEKLYNITRSEAFSIMINKAMKNQILRRLIAVDKSLSSEPTIPYQTAHQMLHLCKQKSIQYLGRSIDLNCLLSQRLLFNLKKSLDACISYFESTNLENIVLLTSLIDVFEMTHSILSENFDLPKFSLLLTEVNSSLIGYLSRITGQIWVYIVNDLSCNYSYCSSTQRFIKSPISFTEQSKVEHSRLHTIPIYGTRAMAVAFEEYHVIYTKFIGDPHFRAFFKFIGYSGVSFLIEEIKSYISSSLIKTLTSYVTVLKQGMPKKSILPRSAYGFIGVIQYFDAILEAILKYPDLRSGVLHNFRQFGNFLALVYLLEKAIHNCEALSLYFSAPHCGIITDVIFPDDYPVTDKINSIVNDLKSCMISSVPNMGTDTAVKNIADRAHILNQEKLCCGLSIFSNFLDCLPNILNDTAWVGNAPLNGVIEIEESTEFHHVFSAILYYLSLPISEFNTTNELVFGDGILFAGLASVIALGQLHRFEALDYTIHAVRVYHLDLGTAPSIGLISSSVGTIRTGTVKLKSLRKDQNKVELSEEASKTFQRMEDQLRRRECITKIIASSLNHPGVQTGTKRNIKCFFAPEYKS